MTQVSWRARGAVGALGLCSVVPLLAWVYGLGSFAAWFWRLARPRGCVLGAIAWRVTRSRSGTNAPAGLQAVLVTGTVGGLVGTIGYDLFRVPFVASGLRVLAPIDSYGVLLLDARTSSPLSGFAGWVYHFSNESGSASPTLPSPWAGAAGTGGSPGADPRNRHRRDGPSPTPTSSGASNKTSSQSPTPPTSPMAWRSAGRRSGARSWWPSFRR